MKIRIEVNVPNGSKKEIMEHLHFYILGAISEGTNTSGDLYDDGNEAIGNWLVEEVEDKNISKYTLAENGINVRGSDKVVLKDKIRDEDLYEYYIVDREDFIEDLLGWISESREDKELMKQDLNMLMNRTDYYMLSSNSTNDYIFEDSNNFNEKCEELIELNETL